MKRTKLPSRGWQHMGPRMRQQQTIMNWKLHITSWKYHVTAINVRETLKYHRLKLRLQYTSLLVPSVGPNDFSIRAMSHAYRFVYTAGPTFFLGQWAGPLFSGPRFARPQVYCLCRCKHRKWPWAAILNSTWIYGRRWNTSLSASINKIKYKTIRHILLVLIYLQFRLGRL